MILATALVLSLSSLTDATVSARLLDDSPRAMVHTLLAQSSARSHLSARLQEINLELRNMEEGWGTLNIVLAAIGFSVGTVGIFVGLFILGYVDVLVGLLVLVVGGAGLALGVYAVTRGLKNQNEYRERRGALMKEKLELEAELKDGNDVAPPPPPPHASVQQDLAPTLLTFASF